MKYELVKDDTIEVDGITLYRIRATKDFREVKIGDLGGFIEKESNLAHEGNCWVHDNACVYGNAYVHDDAQVRGNAKVFGDALVYSGANVFDEAEISGDAHVCGDTLICGKAQVFDYAQISGDALICGNARVYGDSQISGDAAVSGYANIATQYDIVWFSKVGSWNGTLTVYKGKDGGLLARCGRFFGTVEEFLSKSSQEHNERIYREYQLLVEVAKSRILGDNL